MAVKTTKVVAKGVSFSLLKIRPPKPQQTLLKNTFYTNKLKVFSYSDSSVER